MSINGSATKEGWDMGFWEKLFKKVPAKKLIPDRSIDCILILSNRDPGPGKPCEYLLGKVLGVVNSGSVRGSRAIIRSNSDMNQNLSKEYLAMTATVQFPLNGWSVNLEKIEFIPYSFPEANGVAIVQFK